MRLAGRVGVDSETAVQTYYGCLLFHAGCTANAEIGAELFDEGALVEHFTPVMFGRPGQTLAGIMRALAGQEGTSPGRALQVARKLPRAVREYRRNLAAGYEVAQMLSERLGMPPSVHSLFAHLTERWDGKGEPGRLRGEEIPLALRIAHVARDATFQHLLGGAEFAAGVIRARAGGAFDPAIAATLADDAAAILAINGEQPAWDVVLDAEPGPWLTLRGPAIDEALAAMGDFADLVSPDRVKRLVLISPPTLPKTRCPLPIRLASTPGMAELLSRLVPPSPNSVLRFAHHAAREKETLAGYPDLVDLFVAGFRDPIADRVGRAEQRVFVSPFALLSPSGFRRRSRVRPDELCQVAMPTLVIWGEQDPLGGVSVAQAAIDLIPRARLDALPTGHGPWLGQPVHTAAAVADFVRRDRSLPSATSTQPGRTGAARPGGKIGQRAAAAPRPGTGRRAHRDGARGRARHQTRGDAVHGAVAEHGGPHRLPDPAGVDHQRARVAGYAADAGTGGGSTRRRTRTGAWWASCCAMTPPRDTPSTSTAWYSRASSIASMVRAMPRIRRGTGYAVDSPTPGASKAIACTPRAVSWRSNGWAMSRLAPRPVMSSTGGPLPRTEVRSRTPSTSTNRTTVPSGEGLSGEGADTGDVSAHDEGLDGSVPS